MPTTQPRQIENCCNPGTSVDKAWRTLSRASRYCFAAGSTILLKRGQVFPGQLFPKGSGTGGSVNTIAPYGAGADPVIGQDANSRLVDPLLTSPAYHSDGRPTNQFTLQEGSPAIDSGEDVGSMGSTDFFGSSIPKGGRYDIGAGEFDDLE